MVEGGKMEKIKPLLRVLEGGEKPKELEITPASDLMDKAFQPTEKEKNLADALIKKGLGSSKS
jgi:hypothetical protein